MSDDPPIAAAAATQITRVGERVASVETAIEFVKRDTDTIRRTQHDINNEITKLVAAEIRLTVAVEEMARQGVATQNSVARMAEAIVAQAVVNQSFLAMKDDLTALIAMAHGKAANWTLAAKTGVVVSGFISTLAAAIAIAWQILGRH